MHTHEKTIETLRARALEMEQELARSEARECEQLLKMEYIEGANVKLWEQRSRRREAGAGKNVNDGDDDLVEFGREWKRGHEDDDNEDDNETETEMGTVEGEEEGEERLKRGRREQRA